VALVEAGRLERERGDEDVCAAATYGFGFEVTKEERAHSSSTVVRVDPHHSHAARVAPRPAADASDDRAVIVERSHRQFTCGRDTIGGGSVVLGEPVRQELVESAVRASQTGTGLLLVIGGHA
jgi:hypothetical protein